MFSQLCDVPAGASPPFFYDLLLLMTYFVDSSGHAGAGIVGSNPAEDMDACFL